MSGLLLSGFMPGQSHQGVSSFLDKLLADDGMDLVVVGVLEQHTLTQPRGHTADEANSTLTCRWRSLEVVEGNRAQKVLAMLGEVRSERLGQEALPGVEEAAVEAERKSSKSRRRRGSLSPVPST
jgi:hypothetical protein